MKKEHLLQCLGSVISLYDRTKRVYGILAHLGGDSWIVIDTSDNVNHQFNESALVTYNRAFNFTDDGFTITDEFFVNQL